MLDTGMALNKIKGFKHNLCSFLIVNKMKPSCDGQQEEWCNGMTMPGMESLDVSCQI
ncbi:hypothetical protein KP509_29G009100 [Ceratopteris richardii]|uniref:Uncharacterized protein n=1 Tax=Ceratopteris richardii TaxID=49495 RepID=A0A8T2R6R3_CERRI|nr:hypothetical protein KP509_29G009100 [Ceratopteris richardii]